MLPLNISDTSKIRLQLCSFLICATIFLTFFSSSTALASRLELIMKRGTLIVGVKSDYPPFGMLSAEGALIGFEPDLAAELARRLGVGLKLVAVTTTNRLQRLEEGAIDVVIATLGDTAQRRQISTLIEPNYYASGATALMSSKVSAMTWADLRGKSVCATQGAYFNRAIAERFLLDLQIFNGTRDASLALRDERCIAWLYDDTVIYWILRNPEWSQYIAPLPSAMVSPWAIAIAAAERDSRLERLLSDTVADWHRSGWLISTEQRWGIKSSKFLADSHQLWGQMRVDGSLVCSRLADGKWPPECRNQHLLSSLDVRGLQHVGLLFKEQTGMDLTFIYDPYDRTLFLQGLWITLQLMAACIGGSLLVGCLGALVAESRLPLLSRFVLLSASIGRMTPPLLLIYLVFFGVGRHIATYIGWDIDGFWIAVLCLSAYTGCAIVFALLEACMVLKAKEPGFALSWRSLPHALYLAAVAVLAALVNVVKATGMASVIAVPELISASTTIVAEKGNPAVMMNVLMITYFLLVMSVVQLFNGLQRWLLSHGDH
jgi:polar amino acid transport system substrate-binding protein